MSVADPFKKFHLDFLRLTAIITYTVTRTKRVGKFFTMDNKDKNCIRGGLRLVFRRSKSHKMARDKARVNLHEGKYKNGRDKIGVWYKCRHCQELFKAKDIEVDHVIEIGKFDGDWNRLVDSMFCGPDNLQVLCKDCHKEKTKQFNKTRSRIDAASRNL